ncbi:MAG: hypothetical protein CK431_30115 [Mycobacterium sp.]|nr:MAG: hypothetical protein CK431_30115 [Mycobacterium sp.]
MPEQQVAGQDAHDRKRHAQDSDDSEVPDHEAAERLCYRSTDRGGASRALEAILATVLLWLVSR